MRAPLLMISSLFSARVCYISAFRTMGGTLSQASSYIYSSRATPDVASNKVGYGIAVRGLRSKAKDEEESSGGGGHQAPVLQLSEEEIAARERFQEHQKNAAKLSNAEEVRTLLEYSIGFGTMSTNSKSLPGYPSASVVGFALDEEGNPIFVFSGMSSHTQDILVDPKCGLSVTSKDFKGAADGRVSLIGGVSRISKEDIPVARDIYLKKHPGAFWVDFGDFSWFKMDDLKAIRYVGGFARAGSLTPEEYRAAKPDTITAFSTPILTHMNQDHSDSTVAMVNHYVGLKVDGAEIVSVDRLGMYVKVTQGGESFKLRLPFTREATDRKSIKEIIVEMTQASAESMSK